MLDVKKMKTVEELLLETPIFQGNFESLEDMCTQFEINPAELGMTVLFASYYSYCYEGTAWVLGISEGKLFEVNGSHCSCYGLERQWGLDEVNQDALHHRLSKGELGSIDYGDFRDELIALLFKD